MAARDMEAAQRALRRRTDYEESSDDDDDDDEQEMIFLSTGSVSASPERLTAASTTATSTATTSTSNTGNVMSQSTVVGSSISAVTPSSSSLMFDPYSPTAQRQASALIDREDDALSVHTVEEDPTPPSSSSIPIVTTTFRGVSGGAGYLEMEDAPPSRGNVDSLSSFIASEPITTSSGLLLTHRRPSPRTVATTTAAATPTSSSSSWRNPHGGEATSSRHLPLTRGNPTSVLGSTSTRTTVVQRNGVETVIDRSDPLSSSTQGDSNDLFFQSKQLQFFEVERGFFTGWTKAAMATHDDDYYYGDNHDDDGNDKRRHSMPMLQARRFLSYVRIWMLLSAIFLVLATGVLVHAFGHTPMVVETAGVVKDQSNMNAAGTVTASNQQNSNGASQQQQQQQYVVGGTSFTTGGAKQIILVPLQDISNPSKRQQFVQQQQQQQQQQQFANYIPPPQRQLAFPQLHQHQTDHPQRHGIRRALRELREEFDGWAAHHGKNYHSAEEKEKRFRIWTENHQRYVCRVDSSCGDSRRVIHGGLTRSFPMLFPQGRLRRMIFMDRVDSPSSPSLDRITLKIYLRTNSRRNILPDTTHHHKRNWMNGNVSFILKGVS